jgi:hypothetical protein
LQKEFQQGEEEEEEAGEAEAETGPLLSQVA